MCEMLRTNLTTLYIFFCSINSVSTLPTLVQSFHAL